MIYIKETFPDDERVDISVDGFLDRESIPILKRVCTRHLEGKRSVMLNLRGIVNMSRDGRDFLLEIQNKVIFLDLPEFIEFMMLKRKGSI